MWYDCLEDQLMESEDLADAKAEADSDEYWRRLEYFFYQIQKHDCEKTFEGLRDIEIEELKINFRTFMQNQEASYNPERFYGVGR